MSGGTITEIAGGGITTHARGNIEMYARNMDFQAGTNVEWRGDDKGIILGVDPQDPPPTVDTEVLEIRLITPLDQGYNYENGTIRDGAMYDKVYEFEVVRFKDNVVAAESDIRWSYRYDGKDGVVEEEFGLTGRGRRIRIHLANLDVCGRGLTIRAFVKNNRGPSSYNLWVHYRFRWFRRDQIRQELGFMKQAAQLKNTSNATTSVFDQNATSLCGMAAIFYTYAKDFPNKIEEITLLLHQTGEYRSPGYNIKPNPQMYEMNPQTSLSYPGKRIYTNGNPINPPILMKQADWILMACTRSSESGLGYTGEAGQDASAINWGIVMEPIMRQLMGYTVEDHIRITTGFDFESDLRQIQQYYAQGYHIIFLIDSDMLDDTVSLFGCTNQWHYIVYEGDLTVNANDFTFKHFTWGRVRNKAPETTIRKRVFNTNFYGYYKISI